LAGALRGQLSLLGKPADGDEEVLGAKRRTGLPDHPRLFLTRVPHRVHGAAPDVELVPGRQAPLLASDSGAKRPGDHLEVLLLLWVEMLERLNRAGLVSRLHLHQLAAGLRRGAEETQSHAAGWVLDHVARGRHGRTVARGESL